MAEGLGWDHHERQALHYELVKLCFGTHTDPITGFEIPNVRSSKLDTAEFSKFMEWIVRWAMDEHKIYIPLPSEVDLDALTTYTD